MKNFAKTLKNGLEICISYTYNVESAEYINGRLPVS